MVLALLASVFSIPCALASIKPLTPKENEKPSAFAHTPSPLFNELKALEKIREARKGQLVKAPLVFDIPVTYNQEVSRWIQFFQGPGRGTLKRWLERSYKYFPMIQGELDKAGLPKDLAYMVMIESGFAAHARSHAEAVGPWQFIKSTANRYHLKTTDWLDERKDLKKSTHAAIKYLRDLSMEFNSWWLVAASYNMGENGLRRAIKKHATNDYWELCRRRALPPETREYVPKLLAAMLIAKAPSLYGFRDIEAMEPVRYQYVQVPGGIELDELADYLNITRKHLRDLNAELFLGYIPRQQKSHIMRVPMGAKARVSRFVQNIAMKSDGLGEINAATSNKTRLVR